MVLNQDFYSTISADLNSKFRGKIHTRDHAKLYVQYWLSGSFNKWNVIKLIKSIFPLLTEFISTYNEGGNNKLLNNLMKSESYLVNELIIKRIGKEFPESIIFNLFDGFLIDEANHHEAYHIALEESNSYFGFDTFKKIKVENRIRPLEAIRPSIIEKATASIIESKTQLESLKVPSPNQALVMENVQKVTTEAIVSSNKLSLYEQMKASKITTDQYFLMDTSILDTAPDAFTNYDNLPI